MKKKWKKKKTLVARTGPGTRNYFFGVRTGTKPKPPRFLVKVENRPTLVWHWFGYSWPRVYNTAKQRWQNGGSGKSFLGLCGRRTEKGGRKGGRICSTLWFGVAWQIMYNKLLLLFLLFTLRLALQHLCAMFVFSNFFFFFLGCFLKV